MALRSALAIAAALFAGSGLGHAAGLDIAAVNSASRPVRAVENNHPDAGVLKAQSLLDRAGFLPGEIDVRAPGDRDQLLRLIATNCYD
jgi:hypothetical protein